MKIWVKLSDEMWAEFDEAEIPWITPNKSIAEGLAKQIAKQIPR